MSGKTPEITIDHGRLRLRSIRVSNETKAGALPHIVGLRDRTVIAVLIYTAAGIGTVARLKRGSLGHDGGQWTLRFAEKGGKSREIPLRHDLEGMVLAYLEVAGQLAAGKDAPMFQSVIGKTKQLEVMPAMADDLGPVSTLRLYFIASHIPIKPFQSR